MIFPRRRGTMCRPAACESSHTDFRFTSKTCWFTDAQMSEQRAVERSKKERKKRARERPHETDRHPGPGDQDGRSRVRGTMGVADMGMDLEMNMDRTMYIHRPSPFPRNQRSVISVVYRRS